uniref:PurM-like C-terminal domain-containing protein n=1 Tax=Rhodnius prolixus TaxID=13249 RepID=T1H9Q6_RHOPR
MTVIHLYSCPGLQSGRLQRKKEDLMALCPNIIELVTECCHNIEVTKELTKNELSIVHWLLSDPFLNEKHSDTSSLLEEPKSILVEIGPRLNFSTAYSSNAVSICKVIGITSITRIEISMRYLIRFDSKFSIDKNLKFKGKLFLDDCEQCTSLIDMIIATQKSSNSNNVIKFSDNSSAIEGFEITRLIPEEVCQASAFKRDTVKLNLIFTAETHNFPTGVAPFSGATTGTGGRIRDVEAVGRGGNCIAGTAGYSVGNLLIPGYEQPWENTKYHYPDNLATPLKILIEASDGASDYGNKFGEPIIAGFTRATGLEASGERVEWIKPIMFTGGVGTMDHRHTEKVRPARGMKIIKIGGPVYRIGVGGGSASSIEVQGDNESDLDFNAVQRGDAEMENKLNRVIRSCIEDSQSNPILSIHDQGAGGNGISISFYSLSYYL